MTWETVYDNRAFLAPTDWLIGEEDGGGGISVEASALVHKRADGFYYMGDVKVNVTGTTEETHYVDGFRLIPAPSGSPYFIVNEYTITHAAVPGSTAGSSIMFRGADASASFGLRISDTNNSHTLKLSCGSNLTANRVLTFTTGDADRTLDISAGSVTISTAGAALIDDANAAAQRTTLGLDFSGALVTKAADQTAANFTGSASALAWDSETYDTGGFHESVTNPSRLTVPAGVSRVRLVGQVYIYDLTVNQDVLLSIRKNGSTAYAGVALHVTQSGQALAQVPVATAVLAVSPGDYFELFIQIASDTSVSVNVPLSWFAIEAVT